MQSVSLPEQQDGDDEAKPEINPEGDIGRILDVRLTLNQRLAHARLPENLGESDDHHRG